MRPLIAERANYVPLPPRDPAPSRGSYRLQRFLLTRGVRGTLRIGLPVALCLGVGAAWLAQPDNRGAVVAQFNGWIATFQQSPQFMVQGMEIIGADVETMRHIAKFLPAAYPVSSFDLELDVLKAQIEGLEMVKTASVRVMQGGMLRIDLTPREPAALWRDGNVLRLIDPDGIPSGVVTSRIVRPDLPLIAGDGAQAHLTEGLALYENAGPLRSRMRGLVRMGERRWDIVLDRNQRILLPAVEPVVALERVIVLDRINDMLARDISVIDMRNPDRPTLRLSAEAADTLRRGGPANNNNDNEENGAVY